MTSTKKRKYDEVTDCDNEINDWKDFITLRKVTPENNDEVVHQGFLIVTQLDWESTVRNLVIRSGNVIYKLCEHVTGYEHILSYRMLAEAPDDCPFIIRVSFTLDSSALAHIHQFDLMVSPKRFNFAMKEMGIYPCEVIVNRLIRGAMTRPFNDGNDLKLTKIQEEKDLLMWMQGIEYGIENGYNQIELNLSTVQIPGTNWMYNRETDTIEQRQQTPLTDIHYGGGLIINHGVPPFRALLSLVDKDTTLPQSGELVPTRATLLVVPFDVPAQWIDECKNCGLTVKIILSRRDLCNFTTQNIQEADVVITSYQLLRSKKYDDIVHSFFSRVTADENVIPSTSSALKSVCRHLNLQIKGYAKGPILPLQCFQWQRIIYNNVSLLVDDLFKSQRARVVPKLYSRIVWGLVQDKLDLSKQGALEKYCQVLQCKPPFWNLGVVTAIADNIMCRFEPEQIQFREVVYLIELTPGERQGYEKYESSGARTQVLACTYHHFDDRLGQIHHASFKNTIEMLRKKKQYRVEESRNTLQVVTSSLEDAKRSLHENKTLLDSVMAAHAETEEREGDDEDVYSGMSDDMEELMFEIDDEEERIEILTERKKIAKNRIDNSGQSALYFDRIAAQLNPNNLDKCPICFEKNCDTMTICAHLFCRECLSRHFQQYSNCPVCKDHLSTGDSCQIRDVGDAPNGTKFDAIVHKIQQWKDDKIIIVSQFSRILKPLQDMLDEKNIKSVQLVGNTTTRRTMIQNYNNGSTQVMMVNLEHQSSGMRIGKTDHLVFIHALTGNTTSQLYNCALSLVTGTPTVHWFLAKNTIEKPYRQPQVVTLDATT